MDEMPQFDRAEFAAGETPASRCSGCQNALSQSYYQVDGRVVCPACRDRMTASDTSLSRRERLLMALVYGSGAAVVGSIIWYLVARLTGMELGLIAIGVGILVGQAVKKGSRGRGGRGYQTLAVVLTYLSIVSSYVPTVVSTLMTEAKKAPTAASSPGEAAGTTVAVPQPTDKGAGATDPASKPAMGMGLALVLMAGVVLAIAIAAPFMAGASNIIGLLIIAFALWEAWKINRRVVPQVLGPFSLAPQTPDPLPVQPSSAAS